MLWYQHYLKWKPIKKLSATETKIIKKRKVKKLFHKATLIFFSIKYREQKILSMTRFFLLRSSCTKIQNWLKEIVFNYDKKVKL